MVKRIFEKRSTCGLMLPIEHDPYDPTGAQQKLTVRIKKHEDGCDDCKYLIRQRNSLPKGKVLTSLEFETGCQRVVKIFGINHNQIRNLYAHWLKFHKKRCSPCKKYSVDT